MIRRKIFRFLPAIFVATLFSFAIFAEEEKAENKNISPEALEYIKKYSEFIKTKTAGKVDIVSTINIVAEGLKQEMKIDSSLVFQRPNKVSFITKGDMAGSGIVSDGKKMYSYLNATKKYTEKDAPESLDSIPFTFGNQVSLPTAELIVSSDPEREIMEGVISATVLGKEKVGDHDTVRIKFEQDMIDWEMWIRTGGEPLIEKIVPDMSKLMSKSIENKGGADAEKIAELIKKMKYDFLIEFKNWELDKALPEDAFKFIPPQGFVKSENLFPSKSDIMKKKNSLIGANAPDFELQSIDKENKTIKLSDHKGKNIVVLDFWATWCPPCRRALPIVIKATSAFKDKGIVFYAVNQGEDPETIRNFLKESELECNVLLDKNSSVGNKYFVESIPTTFIIGKDGKVKSVHSGFSEDLGNLLVDEIQKILNE